MPAEDAYAEDFDIAGKMEELQAYGNVRLLDTCRITVNGTTLKTDQINITIDIGLRLRAGEKRFPWK